MEIRLMFAYAVRVFNPPDSRRRDFIANCKGFGENIPAPVQAMPDTWIIAHRPLYSERRAYLPTEIFRGRLSHRLSIHVVKKLQHG